MDYKGNGGSVTVGGTGGTSAQSGSSEQGGNGASRGAGGGGGKCNGFIADILENVLDYIIE